MKRIESELLTNAKKRSKTAFEIVESLRAGEIAILPIEQGYVLVSDIYSEEGISKIKELKKLSEEIYLPVLVSGIDQLAPFNTEITPEMRLLTNEFWPGALVLEVKLKHSSTVSLGAKFPPNDLFFRFASNPTTQEVCELMGGLAYSPVIRDGSPVTRWNYIPKEFRDAASHLVQGDTFQSKQRPTIVSFNSGSPVLEKQGDIDEAKIRRLIPKLQTN